MQSLSTSPCGPAKSSCNRSASTWPRSTPSSPAGPTRPPTWRAPFGCGRGGSRASG
ncbi:hypothetical protein ACHAWF_010581 [Thalassiosira exigua]